MENFENDSEPNAEVILQQIERLRATSLKDLTVLAEFQNAVSDWDKEFKIELEERFGSKRYAQQVPAWQRLIGGTVEEETDITSEQRRFVLQKIQSFIKSFTT